MAQHQYSLVAHVILPNFEAERRYVHMETELAKREMHKLPARSWLWFSYPGLGMFRRKDWHEYIHTLTHYRQQLERHEKEVGQGLVPVEFDVIHEGGRADRNIKVHLTVERGAFHASKKAPERPPRIDGSGKGTKFHRFTGFVRRGIRIGQHGVEAEFSKLGAKDMAMLVNQRLYLRVHKDTTLKYHIHSARVPHGVHGEIKIGEKNGLISDPA